MSNNPYDPDALAVPGSRLQPKRAGVTITIAPTARPAPTPPTPTAPPSPATLHPVQPQPAHTGRIGTDPAPPSVTVAPPVRPAPPTGAGTARLHPVQPQPAVPYGLANGSGAGAASALIYNSLKQVNPNLKRIVNEPRPSTNYLSPSPRRGRSRPPDDAVTAGHGRDRGTSDGFLGIDQFLHPDQAIRDALNRAGIPVEAPAILRDY